MNNPEPDIRVNVDAKNPGQFFACCGLLELAHRLWPRIEGWFENGVFCLEGLSGQDTGFHMLLKHLSEAKAEALAGSNDPKLPPVRIGPPYGLRLDWWLDSRGGKTIFGKMFSGQKRTLTDVERLQSGLGNVLSKHENDVTPFDWSEPLPGRFGVDPRAAWESLDVGFSPNDQQMAVETYVVVELLGAIGLQVCPPMSNGEFYDYTTWSRPLGACVSRAASVGIIPGLKGTTYRFALTRRGSYKGFGIATLIGEQL